MIGAPDLNSLWENARGAILLDLQLSTPKSRRERREAFKAFKAAFAQER